ncbi:hypothetical protein IscW_ISCW005306, partial [Ixodes scapularis]
RHDIALIKLASPFDIKESEKRIGTVCLPRMNRALGREVTISGWGLTSPSKRGYPLFVGCYHSCEKRQVLQDTTSGVHSQNNVLRRETWKKVGN